ncbi:Exosome complex component RRP43 [Apophysomyces sp. BC1034]|nr:Exosome complex component RRP43 [Apophysomyces sp. BC1021]KAG0184227.1 Exosome complex component RRP43 [Apophysomyces sp. BC1034]
MAQVTTTAKNFEIFSRIQPHEYLRRFLDQEVRPDGRLLDQFRNTLITAGAISTTNASAMVRLGGTTVVCGIKAEVCEPKVEKPDEVTLPKAELSSAMTVEADASEQSQPIQLNRFPVSSTFCLFNHPSGLLSDPNDTEENLAKETMTVVMDSEGSLCRVYKNGGVAMQADMLRTCFGRAKKRTEEVRVLIEQAINK